jgi:hypothetical protein
LAKDIYAWRVRLASKECYPEPAAEY